MPTHKPGKPTVVIVLGPEGANAADVLAPYEVLAATGAFNLYTVAPRRQPVPLTGNLDLVPDLGGDPTVPPASQPIPQPTSNRPSS